MKHLIASSAVALFAAFFGGLAAAAQSSVPQSANMDIRTPGVKFCPAPGCDNDEFIDTHFGIDAKTGQVTKYTGTVHPDETNIQVGAGEQILYVSPPISVESRYVPPAGASRMSAAVPVQATAPRQGAMNTRRNQNGLPPAVRQSAASQPVPVAPPAIASARGAKKMTAATAPSGQRREAARLPWWKRMWRN